VFEQIDAVHKHKVAALNNFSPYLAQIFGVLGLS
jgi:hypothetical protein